MVVVNSLYARVPGRRAGEPFDAEHLAEPALSQEGQSAQLVFLTFIRLSGSGQMPTTVRSSMCDLRAKPTCAANVNGSGAGPPPGQASWTSLSTAVGSPRRPS